MTSAKKRERGQGSIGHVPGSRFLYIWYYDNAGRQHRESTKSTLRSVAQETLNQRLAAMGRGEKPPTDAARIRYEDMRQILLNEYKLKGIAKEKVVLDESGKPTGLKRTGLKFLDDFFRGMRLSQIDTDVLQAYRNSRGCDETTKDRDLALLRRMVNLTVRQKKLQIPTPYFPMSGQDHVRTGFVEPAKFDKLLKAMPEGLRPYLLFFYETGCRPKATKQIVWDWVSLDERVIWIPPGVTKNDEPLPVPISERLCKMLRKKFRVGEVFPTTNFRKAFRAACVKVELGERTGSEEWHYQGLLPYDLRRSAVRNLKRAGVDDDTIMKITGHLTKNMITRYNIVDVKDVKRAMEEVERHNASLIQVAQKQGRKK